LLTLKYYDIKIKTEINNGRVSYYFATNINKKLLFLNIGKLIKIVFIIFILNVFYLWYKRLKVYGKDLLLLLKNRKIYLLTFINYLQFFIFILYFVIGFPCYYISLLIFLLFY